MKSIGSSNKEVTKSTKEYVELKAYLGNHAKILKQILLNTCLIHSDDERYICGSINRYGAKCKQLKGKCVYHGSYKKKVIETPTICSSTNKNGESCSKSIHLGFDVC